MDAPRFDALTRLLAHAPSRRALLPLLGSLLAAPLLGVAPAAAKKKKKKKKTTLCLDGQTIQASKKRKKKLLKSGATPGACSSPPPPPPPGCTPACAGTTCGGDDGCGGTCGCAAGSVCHAGVCNPCTVSCGGNGAVCGNDLKTALIGGGTIRACPGRYLGNFTLTAPNTVLIGAGDRDDPATNTILDANGNGRVVDVSFDISAALSGLRITGGNLPDGGGGVHNSGTLTMTACTVAGNTAGGAGGILHATVATGPLTLNDCVVSGNNAGSNGFGGGIFNGSGVTLAINGSAITGNEAQFGGGLFNAGAVTFDSASSVTGNTATINGGGIYNEGGTVTLNGANVSGNSQGNCFPVNTITGCAG